MTTELAYLRKYWDPEPVLTTEPAWAPRPTGEVVISVPLRKFLELLIIPVMDPFGFCFQRVRIGRLGSTFGVGLDLDDDPPKREKEGRAGASAFTKGFGGGEELPKMLSVPDRFGIFGSGFFAAGFPPPPPNKLRVPDRCGTCGLEAAFFCALNRLMVPGLLGTSPVGASGLTVFLAAMGEPPIKENGADMGLGGAWIAGSFRGSGAGAGGPKKLNDGVGAAFLATGAGA
jgi:hypothetical protein